MQEQEALDAQQWECVKTGMCQAQAAGPSIQPPQLQQLQLQVITTIWSKCMFVCCETQGL